MTAPLSTAPPVQRGKPAHVWQGIQKRDPKISKDFAAHPWVYRCPAPMCFYNISAKTEKDINRLAEVHQSQTDACPWFAGGETKYGWSVMSAQFVTPIWKQLDARLDIIKDPSRQDALAQAERERAQHEARGLATALAILMPPFFDNTADISREALRRWQVRQEEGFDPERSEACYQTKGIGKLSWKAAVERAAGGEEQTLAKVEAANLSETDITGIKTMLASGLFPVEKLAATYKVSVAYIKSLA